MSLRPVTSADYHADLFAEKASLSASIAHILVTQSPAHAAAAHPRLNASFEREHEEKFDLGTAAHALMLEGRNGVSVIEAKDWRTDDAKTRRDQARAEGRIPMLAKDWGRVQAMVARANEQLDRVAAPRPFTDGKPEQMLMWEDGGVECRALIDWLRDDHATIDDYKTTGASAHPESWQKTLYGIGADIQAAFYLRGMRAVFDVQPEWRFVVQETFPPYALSLVNLAPSAIELANAKIDYALKAWKRGIDEDVWPAYPPRVASVEAPGWAESAWLGREAMEDAA